MLWRPLWRSTYLAVREVRIAIQRPVIAERRRNARDRAVCRRAPLLAHGREDAASMADGEEGEQVDEEIDRKDGERGGRRGQTWSGGHAEARTLNGAEVCRRIIHSALGPRE